MAAARAADDLVEAMVCIDVNGIQGTTAMFVDRLCRLALGEYQGDPGITVEWQTQISAFVRNFEGCDNTEAGRLRAAQCVTTIWEGAETVAKKQKEWLEGQVQQMEQYEKQELLTAASAKVASGVDSADAHGWLQVQLEATEWERGLQRSPLKWRRQWKCCQIFNAR